MDKKRWATVAVRTETRQLLKILAALSGMSMSEALHKAVSSYTFVKYPDKTAKSLAKQARNAATYAVESDLRRQTEHQKGDGHVE